MKENRNIINQMQTLLKRTKLKLSLMCLLCVLSDKIINKNSFQCTNCELLNDGYIWVKYKINKTKT